MEEMGYTSESQFCIYSLYKNTFVPAGLHGSGKWVQHVNGLPGEEPYGGDM